MADQQNAIQNDNLLGDIDLSGTTSDSTAGVSTSTSSAAATTSQISDLGDVLVDQSIDNMQSKAENTEDFTPTPDAISPITVETPASVPTDLNAIFSIEKSEPTAPVVALSPSYDPANIDLGDISLDPSGGESMPKSMNSNADIASDEIKPTGMFSARPGENPEPTATSTPIIGSENIVPIMDIPAAPIEEAKPEATSIEDKKTVEVPVSEAAPLQDISLETPVELSSTISPETISASELTAVPMIENIEITPAAIQESMPVVATEAAPIAAEIPMTPEKTDNLIDNLVANESEKVAAMGEQPVSPVINEPTTSDISVPVAPAAAPAEEMTLDLDSLTSDLTPQTTSTVTTPAINDSIKTDVNATTPATASVVLPNANLVHPVAHNNAKKKAFAMIAAFVMLLIVGAFVFRTMMPEESKALFAGILGSSEEIPIEQQSDTEVPTQINELISTGDTNTGLDNTQIEIPVTGDTTSTSGASVTGSMTEEPTSAQPDVTLEQATNAVALISQQSKKDLAVALKNKNNVASEALYAVFKESSSLLETLENTFDISTIPDIETQISTLQQNLYQASSLLDGDFNAQS